MRRDLYEPEHELFRETVAGLPRSEVVPHRDRWETEGKVDKSMFRKAGEHGLLGMAVPERFGGGGVEDFRFNAVIAKRVMKADVMGSGMCITLHNDVALPYFLHLSDEEQKERWLPGLASGELMAAIAMTEPGAGIRPGGYHHHRDPGRRPLHRQRLQDLHHERHQLRCGHHRRQDRPVTAPRRHEPARHRGGDGGFTRGRNLEKIGLHAQDTAELFFQDVRVPVENRPRRGRPEGFYQLVRNLPQERSVPGSRLAGPRPAGVRLDARIRVGAHGLRAPIGPIRRSNTAWRRLRTELDVTQAISTAR
jgi:alkylation response protein AidB-like acyl-CoA dehydrogenase